MSILERPIKKIKKDFEGKEEFVNSVVEEQVDRIEEKRSIELTSEKKEVIYQFVSMTVRDNIWE